MLEKIFRGTKGEEIENQEEIRRKKLSSYETTAQFAAEEAAQNLPIDPTYLDRFWWDIPVSKSDTVIMARLAGKYPLCFPAIRKLYTGEQSTAGEISWTSDEDRIKKLGMVQQRLKNETERMAAEMRNNPEMINELNKINWAALPRQLKSLNDIYKYAAAYKFRFPDYAYAYTGVRFPRPREGQTWEEAWEEMKTQTPTLNVKRKKQGR